MRGTMSKSPLRVKVKNFFDSRWFPGIPVALAGLGIRLLQKDLRRTGWGNVAQVREIRCRATNFVGITKYRNTPLHLALS